MSILSNLFSDDNSNSSDFLGVLNVTGDIGLDVANYSYENDDGEIEESYDATSIGSDFDLGSILGSMSDSDNDSDGGLF
jgi:hypothetical protein